MDQRTKCESNHDWTVASVSAKLSSVSLTPLEAYFDETRAIHLTLPSFFGLALFRFPQAMVNYLLQVFPFVFLTRSGRTKVLVLDLSTLEKYLQPMTSISLSRWKLLDWRQTHNTSTNSPIARTRRLSVRLESLVHYPPLTVRLLCFRVGM
jgi:hypothetical protein